MADAVREEQGCRAALDERLGRAVQDAELDERSTLVVNDVTPEPWTPSAICMPCVDGETYFGTRLLLEVVVSGMWIESATALWDCEDRAAGVEPPPEQAPRARMQASVPKSGFMVERRPIFI